MGGEAIIKKHIKIINPVPEKIIFATTFFIYDTLGMHGWGICL
jgi:hypothetical protein